MGGTEQADGRSLEPVIQDISGICLISKDRFIERLSLRQIASKRGD